jgi:DNA-binding NtrC family response regulator
MIARVPPTDPASVTRRVARLTVLVPPLRSRIAEIVPLAEAILVELASSRGHSPPLFTSDARAALEQHGWPGNVGELRDVLEKALVRGDSRVLTATQLALGKS